MILAESFLQPITDSPHNKRATITRGPQIVNFLIDNLRPQSTPTPTVSLAGIASSEAPLTPPRDVQRQRRKEGPLGHRRRGVARVHYQPAQEGMLNPIPIELPYLRRFDS